MKRLHHIISGLFILASVQVLGQESINAAGGEATGAGGSSSYSIGQTLYHFNTGSNGSVAEGVQQPHEISVVTEIEMADPDIECTAYPNPASEYLILELKVEGYSAWNYSLFDIQGRLIETDNIVSDKTRIGTKGLMPGSYLLKVKGGNDHLQTFRILVK